MQKTKRKPLKTIPINAHKLVQGVFSAMNEQNMTYDELAEKAGVSRKILERWRLNSTPQLATLERVLKALGLQLVIYNDRI